MPKQKIIEINRTKETNKRAKEEGKLEILNKSHHLKRTDNMNESLKEMHEDFLRKSANTNIDTTPLKTLTINDSYQKTNNFPTINLTKYTSYSKYSQKLSF